jgi:ribosomal protein S18 acetylase RimI-like enzyme
MANKSVKKRAKCPFFSFHLARPDSLTPVRELEHACFKQVVVDPKDDVLWLVATNKFGKSVATGGLWIYGKQAKLVMSCVLPAWRGYNLQKRLIMLREGYARAEGCTRVWAEVHTENGCSLRNFEKLGYEVSIKINQYYVLEKYL